MDDNSDCSTRFSRRSLIAGAIGGAMAITFKPASGQQLEFSMYGMAQLTEYIRTTADRQLAIHALAEVFSRSGIAVYDEGVTALLCPIVVPPSPLAFLESQVGTMVDELRLPSFRAAGEFDTFGPEFSEAGDPVPLFSDMYTRYAVNGTSSGSEFVRQILMTTPEGEGEMPANMAPAPGAAVSVLTGEILAELQGQIDSIVDLQIPTLPPLPNLPTVPAPDELFELPPLPELDNQVCGNVQMFVNNVIQRVLAVLEQTRDIVTIPIIDQIFGAIVGIVKFGLRVIIKAIDIVIAPVIGVLKSIAAAVAIAANILGTISMWTVALTATPDRTRLGVGPVETITGDILVNAGGADDIPWPPIVTNCAAALSINLPSRTSAGSPVNLQMVNPAEKQLVSLGQEERVLGANGELNVTYATMNETQAEVDRGKEEIGVVYLTADIEREDLRRFSEHLLDLLLAELPDIIANILREVTLPIARDFRDNIIKLTRVSATSRIYVTYHRMHCLRGHFFVANTHSLQMVSVWEGVPAANGTGTYHWWFNADGSCTFSLDGSTIKWNDGATTYYTGVAEGSYDVSDGMVHIAFKTSSAVATTVNSPRQFDGSFSFSPAEMTANYGQFALACGGTIYLRNIVWGDIWWLGPVVD